MSESGWASDDERMPSPPTAMLNTFCIPFIWIARSHRKYPNNFRSERQGPDTIIRSANARAHRATLSITTMALRDFRRRPATPAFTSAHAVKIAPADEGYARWTGP